MQHYESASFQMLRHQYDTPTFKTDALRLDSNEGQLKRLLPKALCLASTEGWVKRLLLLY